MKRLSCLLVFVLYTVGMQVLAQNSPIRNFRAVSQVQKVSASDAEFLGFGLAYQAMELGWIYEISYDHFWELVRLKDIADHPPREERRQLSAVMGRQFRLRSFMFNTSVGLSLGLFDFYEFTGSLGSYRNRMRFGLGFPARLDLLFGPGSTSTAIFVKADFNTSVSSYGLGISVPISKKNN